MKGEVKSGFRGPGGISEVKADAGRAERFRQIRAVTRGARAAGRGALALGAAGFGDT